MLRRVPVSQRCVSSRFTALDATGLAGCLVLWGRATPRWIGGLFAILEVAVGGIGWTVIVTCFGCSGEEGVLDVFDGRDLSAEWSLLGEFADCVDSSTSDHGCFDQTHGGKVILVEYSDRKEKRVVAIFRSGAF